MSAAKTDFCSDVSANGGRVKVGWRNRRRRSRRLAWKVNRTLLLRKISIHRWIRRRTHGWWRNVSHPAQLLLLVELVEVSRCHFRRRMMTSSGIEFRATRSSRMDHGCGEGTITTRNGQQTGLWGRLSSLLKCWCRPTPPKLKVTLNHLKGALIKCTCV